jgi:hypothetical protein
MDIAPAVSDIKTSGTTSILIELINKFSNSCRKNPKKFTKM